MNLSALRYSLWYCTNPGGISDLVAIAAFLILYMCKYQLGKFCFENEFFNSDTYGC